MARKSRRKPLGKMALRRGDKKAAARDLLAAAGTPGCDRIPATSRPAFTDALSGRIIGTRKQHRSGRIPLQPITPSIRGRPSAAAALAGNASAGSPWRAAGLIAARRSVRGPCAPPGASSTGPIPRTPAVHGRATRRGHAGGRCASPAGRPPCPCSRAPATRWRRRAGRPFPRPAAQGSGPGRRAADLSAF
jgi:hypothetical protein